MLYSDDGGTRRERNDDFGASDKTPTYEIKTCAKNAWRIFWELHRRRGECSHGIARFNDLKIEAWQRLSGERITNTEYEILWNMDDAFCESVSIEMAAEQRKQAKEQEANNG